MNSLGLYRSDYSSYFRPHFGKLESERLSQVATSCGRECHYFSTLLEAQNSSAEIIILTNSQTDFSKFTPELLARTKLLIHANSGYDNISAEFVAAAPFPIVIGNEIRAEAVATYILSCLFNHLAQVPFTAKWDPARAWERVLLSSLNILILGHGHIGRLVAASLQGLGVKPFIYDPYQEGYNELPPLAQMNVVIPLMSLNESSRGFINHHFLKQLASDVLIINAARGGLIDEAALISFLARSPQAYAYLDVFATEPCDFSIFKTLNNVKLSSHVAGVYGDLDQVLIDFEAQVLGAFLKNRSEFLKTYHAALLNHRLIAGKLF